MKIVFIEPAGQGGLAHFAYELCQALSDEGHKIKLVTSTSFELRNVPRRFTLEPSMHLWDVVDRGAPERRSRMSHRAYSAVRRIFRGARLTVEWARITWRIVKEAPDAVIFSEMPHPHLAFAPFAIRSAGIKTCQICHEFTERDAKSSIIANLSLKAAQVMFRQFDRILFLSNATRLEFLDQVKFDPAQTALIPHGSQDMFGAPCMSGLELKRELGIPDAEPVALYFGYIRPSKGIGDLIEAFALSSWRDKARLVIAGHVTKFADFPKLEARVRKHDLADRVIFKAAYIPNDHVGAYFEMARVVVLPYRSASQSGVLHLAYGRARPVIATSVGGLAEDVFDGESGLLVPPGEVKALSKALDLLFEDEDLAGKMGRKARELSETHFTWSAAARIITDRLEEARSGNTSHKSGRSSAEHPQVRLDA